MTHPTLSDATTQAFIAEMDRRGKKLGKPPLNKEEAKAVAEMMEKALQAALAHQHQDAEVVEIDLDKLAYEQMCQAAAASTWMPSEYHQQDWVSDVCAFLKDGPTAWNANMDEAPRDGTPILVTRPTEFETEEGWHVVRWDDDWWQVHCGKFDHPLRGDDPTHWQHLPKPPKEQG